MGWERWVPTGDDKRSFAPVSAAAVVVVVVATVVDVKVSFVPASAVLAAELPELVAALVAVFAATLAVAFAAARVVFVARP